MVQKNTVVGCIDGSSLAKSVCLYSSWLAKRLNTSLTFLHVLEKPEPSAPSDLSGNIGFNSQEQLMHELVKIEGERARVMMKQGKHLLDGAKKIATQQGIDNIEIIQKRGLLPEILSQIQNANIMVLGRQGECSEIKGHIGSQLESVIRLQKTPVLISVNNFIVPRKIMFAYDGSDAGKIILKRLSNSSLLKDIDCHIVMNGDDNSSLLNAQIILQQSGIDAHAHLTSGNNIPESLCQYAKEHNIDLIIMGAYGHSKLREFFIGSNTTEMIVKTHVPLLMLR